MLKQKLKTKSILTITRVPLVVLLSVLLVGGVALQQVSADRYDEQIRELNQETAEKKQQQSALGAEATSLAEKVANLRSQIATLESQIRGNQTERDNLQQQITEAEAELARQRSVLSASIKQMYVEGDISTIEMLASSKDLSEFVDKQEYRESVQSKIKTTLDTITALKLELKGKKEEVEKLIVDQQAIQANLDSQRAEQNRLLSLNEAEQAALNKEIKDNNARVSELRKQQAVENARLFGTGTIRNVPDTTGYPWANYEPFPNEVADPWGMYLRQCVSYTAWKVWKSGRHMPNWGGRGNANRWDDNARAAGIPVDGSPRAGDIAISNSGYYGHAMYVEAVYDDGTIYISQYNASWEGKYSEARISVGSLVFIHF